MPFQANLYYQLHANQWSQVTPKSAAQSKVSIFCEAEKFCEERFSKWVESHRYAQHWQITRRASQLLVIELFVYEPQHNELDLQALTKLGLDYIVWPNASIGAPQLIVFDMDSTFIEIEVIDELAKRHGVGEQVAKVTELAMQGELDFTESLISRVKCLQGLPISEIQAVAEQLPLSQGITQLVKLAKQNQCYIAIVSGGFMPFVTYLKSQLGLLRVNANQLKATDGTLTGELEGPIIDAQAKADFVDRLAREVNIPLERVMAIGDGANDLLMMNKAGLNIAYRAKPAVQKAAAGQMNVTDFAQLAEVFGWH
ncbi:phosphoserine phosphatase SerB [Aliikangiella sp. IMCC44653]